MAEIRTVGIVGAGQMGNGIAHVFALAGYDVLMTDISQTSLDKAITTIDHVTHGRAGINIVCGWNPQEFAMFGVSLGEKGYVQAAEWVDIIERAVYPFMGEQRSVEDVESARLALEAAYRNAGYGTVVVDTPEQRINEGVVTLQVIEGRLGDMLPDGFDGKAVTDAQGR